MSERPVSGTSDPRRLSRRDMLRKSAIVGGAAAAVWAAPQLTSKAMASGACTGSPLCHCGFYNLDGYTSTYWRDDSGQSMPSSCSGVLNAGLPVGYSFSIATTSTTVEVTLVKDDASQCGREFADAWIVLSCASPAETQAVLSGSPCKRTATFTYSGGLPSNIESCFHLFYQLCGCADS